MAAGHVVILDPSRTLAGAVSRLGLGPELELSCCASGDDVDAARRRRPIEVMIAAQDLGDGASGVAFLVEEHRHDPDGFRILVASDLAAAVGAINAGCVDGLVTSADDVTQLRALIHDGCEASLLRRHYRGLIDELAGSNSELTSLSDRLGALVEERTISLDDAHKLLRHQQEELVRLETQAVVSQLVRGLAHELNNPLAAILGYAQRLRRSWAKEEEAVRRLDVILSEVDRCRGLVEQLRNLAAPLDEEIVPCQPDRLLFQAHARMREAGHPTPECEVLGDVPVVVAAQQSLVRVFEQVLDNARLSGARTCWMSARQANGRVWLTLENDGATPDDNTVRNATRPFFTTMSSDGRRGLGLAIATALLREQAGNLELAARTGAAGAACVIQLPARPVTTLLPALPAVAGRVATVLVVDDEPLVAELLLDALLETGLSARVVGSVAEALKVVAEHPVRAMLADVQLPDGSGVELVRRALLLRPALIGHVALITGGGDSAEKIGVPPGMDWPVLGKPFRLEQVAKLVRSIL